MTAARFRNRPVEVEAIRWLGEENCAEVFAFAGLDHDDWADDLDHSRLYVPDLLASEPARHGDWLVKDKLGITVMRDAEFNVCYEQVPEPEPFDPATNYHESVDHLRRDLMAGAIRWDREAETYGLTERPTPENRVQIAAYSAALMAGSYAYTLAAVLGYAAKYGEQVARDLAFEADELLTNGDFDAMNADVIVAMAEGAPLPDYITVDSNRGSHGEMPGAHWICAEHEHSGTWTDLVDNALAARADAITHLNERHPGWAETKPAETPAAPSSP